MGNKCLVKGCMNIRHQGQFVGDLCAPCFRMLTTGELGCGDTFIHQLAAKIQKGGLEPDKGPRNRLEAELLLKNKRDLEEEVSHLQIELALYRGLEQ